MKETLEHRWSCTILYAPAPAPHNDGEIRLLLLIRAMSTGGQVVALRTVSGMAMVAQLVLMMFTRERARVQALHFVPLPRIRSWSR